MRLVSSLVFSASLLGMAIAAHAADDERDFCSDRPGLGTPACTIAPRHVMLEVGLADWSCDRQAGIRTETFQSAQTLVRIGIDDNLETQIGWNGYGRVRTHDLSTGAVDKTDGAGDVRLAVRRNLMNPDGSGTSVALMPFVNLPVGKEPIGDSDWSAGLIAPVSFSLPHGIGLALTPEVDAAVNQSGNGRHLAFGSVVGLSYPVTEALTFIVEESWFRDRDPSGHTTQRLAGTALAWQLDKKLQLDAAMNVGIKDTSPDREIYLGFSRLF